MLNKQMHGKPLIYFDSAATALKPLPVIETLTDFYANNYGTVHRAIYELCLHSSEKYEQARQTIKNFINASKTEEIIFTKGTTESINLVAYSFGKAFVKPGDEVLISGMEHHSNIVPWQIMCQDRGSCLKVIPLHENGELDLGKFQELLSNRTKIVAIAHISNTLGTINPIKEIISMAHQAGAKVLIDGAQAAPHMPIDVQDLGADFYAFSGHKLYGPTGIGILYGKESILEMMPPYQGGGDMIKTVAFECTTYNHLPLKFEAGTPNIGGVIGLEAALKYMKRIGMETICEWEHALLTYATDKLLEMDGLHIIGQAKEKGAIISFFLDRIHPSDIGSLLDLDGVAVRTGKHCTHPLMDRFQIPGTVRLSFGLYNQKHEIDQFVKFLKTAIMKLR